MLAIFSQIHERLILRRCGNAGVRLIDQNNSWPLLFEHIATGEPPSESFGKSSYLLQMLIELCVCKLGPQGEELAWTFYQHLVLGQDDDGESLGFKEHVELQSWAPPVGWQESVLTKSVAHDGVCVTIRYGDIREVKRDQFSQEVRGFVEKTRATHNPTEPHILPFGVLILGCLMHRSPLPPEMWRAAFGPVTATKKRKRTKA